MKKATFTEYQDAKAEIVKGGKCKEYTDVDAKGRLHKTICCESGQNFHEITYAGATEFWSTLYPESRKYEDPETKILYEGYRGRRRKVVRRLYGLAYWFADEMLKEERARNEKSAGVELQMKDESGTRDVSAECVSVMKGCMAVTVKVINYLKDQEKEVTQWQMSAIHAMLDECSKESVVDYNLPYAIKGLLLLESETEDCAGIPR